MFAVELAGNGVVRDPGFPPYPVFVISVTQPVQSWTVYRRYSSFRSLGEHLGSTVGGAGGLPECPHMTHDMLMGSDDQLDRARVLLQQWLHQTLLFPGVKESQALRNFLCASANSPPPRLEIRWASAHCPSLDEMQMDELFDRHLDDREDVDETEVDGEEEGDDDSRDIANGHRMARAPGEVAHDATGHLGGGAYEQVADDVLSHNGKGHAHANGNGHNHGDVLTTGSHFSNGYYCGDDAMDQAGHSVDMASSFMSRGEDDRYDPAGCDMPNEEDIASSVPIEITFRDPAEMSWNHNGNSALSKNSPNAWDAPGAGGNGIEQW
ncbi:unnamed protein product, partial [Sphacelaria rigidula]